MSGPWTIPVAHMTSNPNISLTIDTLGGPPFDLPINIGNLWDYLGQPAGPHNVEVIVDSVDTGGVIITNEWAEGSTFSFIAINSGRFLGVGGAGGNGGDDQGTSATRGITGSVGLAAISSNIFNISVDIDDGYLLGGGGGGGGGGATVDSGGLTATPGDGGGGGAALFGSAPGQGGSYIGTPSNSGTFGTAAGPGAGGGNSAFWAGGIGGDWGAGGEPGYALNPFDASIILQSGGAGGRAGKAFDPTLIGPTITFDGAKSEATLRAEQRLRGEITHYGARFRLGGGVLVNSNDPGTSTHGITFQNDGRTLWTNPAFYDLGRWYGDNGTLGETPGDRYEIRTLLRSTEFFPGTPVLLAHDTWGNLGISPERKAWDTEPIAQGEWIDLSVDRTWEFTADQGVPEGLCSFFEIRMIGAPNDDIIDSGWIAFSDAS